MSNHLTGEITNELVRRCTNISGFDRIHMAGIRRVLEEAVRVPVVLCKYCKEPIVRHPADAYTNGGWWHDTDRYVCNLKAEPE